MFCKYCGAKIHEEGKFCPECGIETQSRRCIRCAKPLPYGARYCDKCGELVADQHWTWDEANEARQQAKRKQKQKAQNDAILKAVLTVLAILILILLLLSM